MMASLLFGRSLLLVRGRACFTDILAPRPVGAFLACSGGDTQLGQKPLRRDYVESNKSNTHIQSGIFPLGSIC